MNQAKPCPFCGKRIEVTDVDTLYPSGIGWTDHHTDGFRSYHKAMEVPKEQWCYKIVCAESHGGCGAEMHGDDKEEAIEKWNQRV